MRILTVSYVEEGKFNTLKLSSRGAHPEMKIIKSRASLCRKLVRKKGEINFRFGILFATKPLKSVENMRFCGYLHEFNRVLISFFMVNLNVEKGMEGSIELTTFICI